MNTETRRNSVLALIQKSEKPLSASALAKEFEVSRQLIVGDVALLRASGHKIIATPRGYVCEAREQDGFIRTIAVTHEKDQLEEEIYTIVDLGGALIDVIVEHPLYGQLCAKLHIYSRYDADQFLRKVKEYNATPLSDLTHGLHLHTLQCKNEEVYDRVLNSLREKGFLYEKEQ